MFELEKQLNKMGCSVMRLLPEMLPIVQVN